jgi:hypothetical protein
MVSTSLGAERSPAGAAVSVVREVAAGSDLGRLRERMSRMQGGDTRRPLVMHPALEGVVRLHTGASYEVDSVALALALVSGPSRSGSWCAVVGVRDFGVEAAHELGVDLDRTLLVPDPGDLWLDVAGSLVDVADLVVVRPPDVVSPRAAERLSARLRTRSAVLVSIGPWPRAELRLRTEEPRWSGPEGGYGHLRSRQVVVTTQRGSAPPRRTPMMFPAVDAPLRRVDDLTRSPGLAPVAAAEPLSPMPVREAG